MPLTHNYYPNLFLEQFASSTVGSTLIDASLKRRACVKITVHCMLSSTEAGRHSGAVPFFFGGVAQ